MDGISVKLTNRDLEMDRFSFLSKYTTESLLNDVMKIVYSINPYMRTFNQRNGRIYQLNYALNMLFDTYESETMDYQTLKYIKGIKKFIMVTNKSFNNFNFTVQLLIEEKLYNIKFI